MASLGTGGFSPDGSLFATCHPQGFVLIWEVATGRIKQRLRLGGMPTTVQFHHDGEHLLVSGSDHSIYYINARTGQGNHGQRLEAASRIRRIAIARDKPRLIIDGDDPSSAGPLLETWELYSPQAKELTASFLLPPLNSTADEREVADWILKVGGRLFLPGNSRPLLSVSELPAGPWHVEKVSFERCPILPGEYECLLKLGPQKLELGLTQLTDHDLNSIKSHLPRVMDLKIGHSLVTDAALDLLADHRNLGQLDVQGT
jgi:WD40 repeat protein